MSAMQSTRLYYSLLCSIGLAYAAPVPENATSSVEYVPISDYNTTELRMLIVIGTIAMFLWIARVAYYCRMEDKLDPSEDKKPENVDVPRYFFSPR